MLCDTHVHTFYSTDSETQPEEALERAIRLGMQAVCITDHYDINYPHDPAEFYLDTEPYLEGLAALRERYRGRLDVFTGIEMGLEPQPEQVGAVMAWLEKYGGRMDFVIGSMHCLNRVDIYYRDLVPVPDAEMYRAFLEQMLEDIRLIRGIDALGHLDYMTRYGYEKQKAYSYAAYSDVIDEILRELIRSNIALEVNSAGIRMGLGYAHPHPDVLRRYRELGGELLTVGSDAHAACDVGADFEEVREVLLDCGFRYYAVYRRRRPEMLALQK